MKILRKFLCAFVLATAALTLNSCFDQGESKVFRKGDDTPIHLAVMLDLDGGQSTLGQEAMNGFLLGLQDAQSGESPYVYVSLIDTKTDPKLTVNSTEAVLPNIVVAAGFTNNDSVLEVGSLFQEKEVPFLTIGATDPSLPKVIGNYIFLTPFGDNAQAAAAADFAFEKFGKTVAIIWDSTSEYTKMLPKYFRTHFEKLGGKVLFEESFDGGCDISTLGTKLKELKEEPSFVYLAGLPVCIGETIASLRSSGLEYPIVGGDGFDTPNLMKGGKEPTTNVWYTTHAWLSNESGTEKAKEFRAAYERAYGGRPKDAFSALGYDAANLLLEVFNRAPSIDSKSIESTLEQIQDFQGVTGTISYTADNHVPKKTVWIIQVEDGKESLATSTIPENVPMPITPSERE